MNSLKRFATVLSLSIIGSTAVAQVPPAGAPPATTPPTTTQPTPSAMLPSSQKPVEWPKEIAGKDLKAWLAELKDSQDGAIREAAVKIIPLFGPSARKDAIKPMIYALRNERDPGVKVNLLLVFGSIGADNDAEARDIVEAMKLVIANSGLGSPYRLHAARGLANYGQNAAIAIPELRAIIADISWETRRAVIYALGHIGRAVDDGKPVPNGGRKGPNPLATKLLLDRLADETSAPVRLEIVQSMILLGPPGYKSAAEYPVAIKPFLDAVNKQLKLEKTPSIQVWLLVLSMLYDGTLLTDTTIQKVAEYIRGTDYDARAAALRALGMIGERSKVAIPSVIPVLKEESETTVEAIQMLAALRTAAREALPELEKLKASKDPDLKALATEAVEIISGRKAVGGPIAPPAAPPAPPKK